MFLPIAQIIVSLILIIFILLTSKEGGLGEQGSSLPQSKSGPEKMVFYLTIFLVITFVVLSLAQLYQG
ncbi:preprotein translocase subunit SecG [Candidatus Shapirobacteria bacterium]|nr:preprotein translocase subunit SecG [Candidatus Shapirobacteria bacterium]